MTATLAKISSKGQIVIPKDLRDKLNLKEGDTMLLYSTDSMLVVRKLAKQESILSVIAGPLRKKVKRLNLTRGDVMKAVERERRSGAKGKGSN